MLPIRCLNGNAFVVNGDSSFVNVQATEKIKRQIAMELTLGEDAVLDGQLTINSLGYEGFHRRSEILGSGSAEFVEHLKKIWPSIEILDHKIENLKNPDTTLVENYKIRIATEGGGAGTFFFNPFLVDHLEKNPFLPETRSFPVDFGAAQEQTYLLNLTIPPSYNVDELPKSMALSLPNGGGRYLFSVSQLGNKLSIISNLTLTHAIYSPAEYFNLREFYSRLIQAQQSQVVLKKK
jgi:hypothetical protein